MGTCVSVWSWFQGWQPRLSVYVVDIIVIDTSSYPLLLLLLRTLFSPFLCLAIFFVTWFYEKQMLSVTCTKILLTYSKVISFLCTFFWLYWIRERACIFKNIINVHLRQVSSLSHCLTLYTHVYVYVLCICLEYT